MMKKQKHESRREQFSQDWKGGKRANAKTALVTEVFQVHLRFAKSGVESLLPAYLQDPTAERHRYAYDT